VIIAAGYDTRSYRLASEGVRFYEIDLPHASEKKQELVRQLMPRHQVRVGWGLTAVTAAANAMRQPQPFAGASTRRACRPPSAAVPHHHHHSRLTSPHLLLQYSWPEFVAADLSRVSLMEALSGTSWDQAKRTMFIIEGLVSRHTSGVGQHVSHLQWGLVLATRGGSSS
jgi:hypothetical protein